MSREAFGDPPESQEPPQVCPVCGGEWHAEDCEFGKEVALRLKAERDAHKLAYENEQLRRLSSLDAMRAGKLAEDVERYSALHARMFAEKTAAQIDAENMREFLHRMLEAPTTQVSATWKEATRQTLGNPTDTADSNEMRQLVSDTVKRDAYRFRKLMMQDKHWLGVFRCDPDGAPSDSLSHVELKALLDAMEGPELDF